MNKKRFSVRLRSECDEVVYSFFDGDKLLDVDMIVDVLNEQQDKIDEIEKNFEDLVNWSSEISKRNVVLDEQIGQLQRENEQLKKARDESDKFIVKKGLEIEFLNWSVENE